MKRIFYSVLFFLLSLHTHAQEWETVAYLPANIDVAQIKVVNEDNIIAAVEYLSLLRWNGTQWNNIGDFTNDFGTPHFYYMSDNDIYVTKNDYLNGDTQNNYNYIAHWDGTSWSNANNLNVAKPINKIHVVNANEMYAVGEFTLPGYNWKPVAKYADGAWSVLGLGDSQAGSYSTYGNLWVNNGDDIYTTSGYSDTGVIRIKQWNGENWEVLYNHALDEAERLSGTVTGDNGSIYSFGYNVETGHGCIARWNGEYWAVLGNIKEDLNLHNFANNGRLSIKYVSENEIYAVGSKLREAETNLYKVAKWNGENWSEVGQLNANAAALSMDIYNGYLYVSGGFNGVAPHGGLGTIVKRFQIGTPVETFNIVATANPTEGGSVSGTGNYMEGSQASMTATANEGYQFVNWMENDMVVSETEMYAFEVISNRNLVANFEEILSFDIVATANPTEGGTVSGTGNYTEGSQASMTATENEGYQFVNWMENDMVVSESEVYAFEVTSNRNLVANFEEILTFDILATANPTEGGTVLGAGNYDEGSQAGLIATANEGYHFVNWMENDMVVSETEMYAFEVTSNRNLVANFEENLSFEDLQRVKFTIYPNPAKDLLYIENPTAAVFEMYIYDMNAKLISQHKINNTFTSQITIAHLDTGTYIVVLKSNDGNQSIKLNKL